MSISIDDIVAGNERFNAYMTILDKRLRDLEVHPRSRITLCLLEMANDGIVFPVYSKPRPEYEQIVQWFRSRHGGKIFRRDMARCYVELIDREPFIINVPENFLDDATEIYERIEDMTDLFWRQVNIDTRNHISNQILHYGRCLSDAELLFFDAEAHIQYAIIKIVSEPTHFGLSKWESQMVAEKTLKAFIRSCGQEPPTKGPDAHSLSKLAELAGKNGLKADLSHLVPLIECKAGVRYREIPVSLEEAVKAHQASIELAALVSREMPPEKT